MSDTGIQSPLGVNLTSSLILNEGLSINPITQNMLGTSKYNQDYTPGSIVNDTCLKWITYAINGAYANGTKFVTKYPSNSLTTSAPNNQYVIYRLGTTDWNYVAGTSGIVYEEGNLITAVNTAPGTGLAYLNAQTTGISVFNYDNLLALGQSRIPALANGLPPSYLINDPSGVWEGQATSGYAISGDGTLPPADPDVDPLYAGQGQDATWFPYNSSNPNVGVTQWGFLRCLALQAWNVFNWQGSSPANAQPEYKNYTTQWITITGFLEQSNSVLMTLRNSFNFLDGTYSNMNDLISADITGVSLSTQAFGQDLINLGKALDLSQISTFGKPSGLLKTLLAENALTQGVTLALRAAGLTQEEIVDISQNLITANQKQELKIYSAFLAIGDIDLIPILKILQCKTRKLIRLADLLDVKKMFPISYTSLTVPIYNTSPGPTNSKTYYLLYVDREINPQLLLPKVKEIVGTIVPPEEPPYVEPVPVVPIIETAQIILAPAVPTIEAPSTQIIDLIPSPLPVPSVPAPDPIPEPTMPPPSPKLGGGGGCVVLDAYLPTVETRLHNSKPVEKAWQIENDFDILLGDEQLKPITGKVVKAMIDFQPCVKIITASGIRLSCSTTAPILTKNKGYIEAPKLFGELIAVMRNGIAFYDEVVSIDDIGYKHVRVIDTGNNSFWAGDIQNAYVLHHNARIEESLDYDKK